MGSENTKIKEILGSKVIPASKSLICPPRRFHLGREVSAGCLGGTPGVPPVAF